MRRSPIESLESRRLLATVLPAFADKIGLTSLVNPNTTFEDNFEGTSLNHDKWQVRYGPRWRKVPNGSISEMSWTTEDSVVVRNGNLELIAHTDTSTGQNRAGYIQSGSRFKDNQPSNVAESRLLDGYSGNFEQAFGYWEARVKFNSLPGQWSAFWVHSYGMVDVGDDASRINHPEIFGTEYDVAEHSAVRQDSTVAGQIGTVAHANGYNSFQRSNSVYTTTSSNAPSFTDPSQFHVYGLLWTPTFAKFYVDGNLVHTETDAAMVSKAPHVAIFSNDIGAGGALFENSGSNFFGHVPAAGYGSLETSTAKLTADYVRVWQLNSEGTPVYGSVGGVVFNDVNSNGNRDAGDAGLPARTVYVDANNNSSLDTGERRAITNASGEYSIGELLPGSYVIRQVLSSGTQTAPTTVAASTVTIAAGVRSTLSFGVGNLNPIQAVVEGRVIRDANGNGIIDTGEAGQANINVYLDYNASGSRDDGEPQVATSSTGSYRLVANRTGSVAIRLNLTGTNFLQTFPANSGGRFVTLANGSAVGAEPFAVKEREATVSAVVEGRVIRDANGNGIIDSGETGQPNINVYLDYNNNSVRDAGEPQIATGAAGGYRLVSNRAGSIAIRLNLAGTNFLQTLPAGSGGRWITFVNGQAVTAEAFAVKEREVVVSAVVEGRVIRDANNNGAFDDGESGQPNVNVYIDYNGNGARDDGEPKAVTNSTGGYRIVSSRVGSFPIRLNLAGTDFVQTFPDGARWVTLTNGSAVGVLPFGVRPRVTYSVIGGTVYTDANHNGFRDAGENGRANVVVYLDLNANGRLDSTEPTRTTSSTGAYRFEQVSPGAVAVRIVRPANLAQTQPSDNGAYWITAVAGTTYGDRNFGVYETPVGARIAGTIYNDVNTNGRRDDGEAGVANIRVYLDGNLNGHFDDGESNKLTSSTGSYVFEQVPAGNTAVRLALTGDYRQITPSENGAIWINTANGGNYGDRNFGIARVVSAASTNTVAGSVLGDWNANGTRQAGENGVSGLKVYLDYNLNGKYDAGEPLAVTNAQGVYRFEAVRAGNLAIRLNLGGVGWLQTYPARTGALWSTFRSGMNLKNQNFMVKPK